MKPILSLLTLTLSLSFIPSVNASSWKPSCWRNSPEELVCQRADGVYLTNPSILEIAEVYSADPQVYIDLLNAIDVIDHLQRNRPELNHF